MDKLDLEYKYIMNQMQLDEIWKSVKGELEVVSNPSHFKTHIPGTFIKNIDEDSRLIEISTSSEFQRNFIEDRMYGHLKEITKKIVGPDYRLMFSVTKKEPSQISETDLGPLFQKETQEEINLSTIAKNSGLNDQFTFERFIVGNNNRLAYAVSTAIADAPGKVYNPFFLYSGVGLGKTHLIQAIGHEVLKRHPEKKVLYKTGEQFLNEVVEAVQRGKSSRSITPSALKGRYRNVDVLIVDDIHSIAGKTSTQEEFFHTFNVLHMAQKQIILTSDRAPNEIKLLEERLSSRFASGMIADIQPPDEETRIAILREKNKELSLNAPDEVLEFIASTVITNIRELEAKLLQTVTKARSEGKDLTKESANSIINQIDQTKQSRITPNTVIKEVGKYYGVTMKEIKGQRRLKTLVLPRQVCMYLLRNMVEMGYQSIGEVLGNRDHSTVLHGVDKLENILKTNTKFSKELEQIKSNVMDA